MNCHKCGGKTRKFGRTKQREQRHRCDACRYTFIEHYKTIRLERSKALLCLKLLVEGNSIRSTERITDVHRDTILRPLNFVGERCEKIRKIPLTHVEADEIWDFVQKKEAHKVDDEKKNDKLGDAYTFVAIEATSKLVDCFQLGRRDVETAVKFTEKLQRAADRRFQLTTDGLSSYVQAVERTFGADIDFAQLVSPTSPITPAARNVAIAPVTSTERRRP